MQGTMPYRLAAVALLFVSALTAGTQPRGKVDWIFLVDTSASMRGVGGTKDIFDDVKESLATFVGEASDGDSIGIVTFDADVRPRLIRSVLGDRQKAYDAIDALEAKGNRTHLGLAIQTGLDHAEMLRGDPTRTRAVVLFTDGKEDVKGIRNPVRIDASLDRVDDTYIFFVSMGEHEPQLDAFAGKTKRTTVLKAPTAEAIREVAMQIRETIEPSEPPAPPPPPTLAIEPATFDLGDVELGASSVEQQVVIRSDRPTRALVRIETPQGIAAEPIGEIAIPAELMLRFDVAEDAAPGAKQIAIRAGNAGATATLNVIEPPVLMRIAKALLVLALLLGAAAFFYLRNKARNRLEGEIEIVQPRVAPDAAFVGLPMLKKNELALSSIVPPDALGGTDARLFVKRSRGEKKVCIASMGGSMRVNDVETPLSELYDADVVQIGDAKLRFNRTGHVRPAGEDL